jgi:hypothetical protein
LSDKLTKSVVEAAKKQDGDSFRWDEQLKGFGLKVTPTGRKVYIYQYRLPGRPTRRYTIGVHGGAWTPEGARQEVKRLMGQVARGLDPAEERKRERSDPSAPGFSAPFLLGTRPSGKVVFMRKARFTDDEMVAIQRKADQGPDQC